jgi:CRP/FNR family transcriptional regulator, anaerobic regulatory protein
MNPLDPLLERMQKIAPLSPTALGELQKIFEVIEVKKKTLLLKPGDVCEYMHYVIKGLVRVYYYVNKDEITSRLMSEGYFITSFMSFFTQKPGNEYIEAYEDCTLLRVHKAKAEALYKKHPEVGNIVRSLTEFSFYLSEERTVALRKTTVAHKVAFFLARHPELVNRVASKHIASYLGISPESYSREQSRQLRMVKKSKS